MRKQFKVMSGMLSLTLAATAIAGIQGQAKTDASSKLKEAEVNIFVMGEQPKSMNTFYKELDKLTKKDLNCTVRFTFSTWTDWQNKYNLMLAANDKIDMCYAADWINYQSYADKNAYLALDKMLPKYAPKIWKNISKTNWSGMKVNGKIYGVPNEYEEYVQHGLVYREDLREKYKLPVINSVASIEKYLDTIKKKEAGMKLPVGQPRVMDELLVPSTKYQYIDTNDGYGMAKGLVVDPNNITKAVNIYKTPEYLKLAKTAKSWADKGFWSKSVLSTKDTPNTLFENGKVAAWFGALPMKAKGMAETLAVKHPGWKVGYFQYTTMNGLVYPCRTYHNVMAIPRTAKNPERALMFLEKLHNDRAYFDLTTYGVKGLNYNLTSDGRIDMTKIDLNKNTFDIAPWGWRTEEFFRDNKINWDGFKPLVKKLKSLKKADPLETFVLDTTKVNTEIAALSQVISTYADPISTGMVNNVNDADRKSVV